MGTSQPENEVKQELNDSGCVQDASVTESYRGHAELLDLSDDVLLCIFRFLPPRDLKALGHTCPRLGALVCDRTLWTYVDARDSFTGLERMKWFLDHCLTSSTQEIKLTGYVDKMTRCLGIQDLPWSGENPQALPARDTGTPLEVEHFLLRMWYPHLPRYAMSPRWPDKREQAGKAYSGVNHSEPPLSPLSQLASEIVDNVAAASSHTSRMSHRNPESSTSKEEGKIKAEDDKNNGSDSGKNCKGPHFTVNQHLFRHLRKKCGNLTSLSLEYCNLDYKQTSLRFFPPTLKRLSLQGCRCYNLPLSASYLGKIQDRLPALEYLNVSECEWFEPASLMPLSKVPNLRELYMRECKRLTECVAYASLATRYGFQKLKILDMRGSPVADSEVSAFGWLPLLEELYVSPPDDSKKPVEHSHNWSDVFEPFVELEPWELEAPEYFRAKSPCGDSMDEEEEKEDEAERFGDVMPPHLNCERRIIVIHPNRPNDVPAAAPQPPANQPAAEDPAQPGPSQPQNRPPESPGPSEPPKPDEQDKSPGPKPPTPNDDQPEPQPGPSKRRNEDAALDLVKRRRIDKGTNTDFDDDDQPCCICGLDDDDMPDFPVRPPYNPKRPLNDSLKKSPKNDKKSPKDDKKSHKDHRKSPKEDKKSHREHRKSPIDDRKSPKDDKKSPKDDKKPPKDDNKRPPKCRTASGQDNDNPQPSTSRQVGLSLGANIIPLHPDDHISKVAVKIHKGYVREHLSKGSTQPPLASVSVNIRPMAAPRNEPQGPVENEGNANPGANSAKDELNKKKSQEQSEKSPEKSNEKRKTESKSCKRPSESKESPPDNPKRRSQNRESSDNTERLSSEKRPAENAERPAESAERPPENAEKPPENAERPPENSEMPSENTERPSENADRHATFRFARLLPVNRPFLALGQNEESNEDSRAPNVVLWERSEGQTRRYVPGRRPAGPSQQPQPVMHIDIDIQRQPGHLVIPAINAFAYHIVSDSSVLRFGRADNDNINYVHIGHNIHVNDPGVRPERSNLRVLSITGFRNITDRSLEHLATAAPHIRHIDFSNSGVTARGVEMFRALRPNCEVIFTDYGRHPI